MQRVRTCSVSDQQQAVRLKTYANQTTGVLAGGMQLGECAARLMTIVLAMPACCPALSLP